MKITAVIEGDFRQITAGIARDAASAATRGVREVSGTLKLAWRAQIVGAGLGKRLSNTIRGKDYPKGRISINAASFVYSNASNIVGAYDQGVTIQSKDGFWLAIPSKELQKSRGARSRKWTPGEWERRFNRRLKFFYGKRGKGVGVLVDVGGDPIRDRVMRKNGVHSAARRVRKRFDIKFWLVPRAKVRKRLSLDRDVQAAAGALPGRILGNWKKATVK